VLAGVLCLVATGGSAIAQSTAPQSASGKAPAAGAKDLFYHDDKVVNGPTPTRAPTQAGKPAPATSPNLSLASMKARPVNVSTAADKDPSVGVHYWIELDGAGPVTADRTFKTGDRIKLHVRSNVDGHLALWTLDPSGQGSILFPTGGADSNPLKAGAEYATPGFIRFQLPAQEERLLVFFSRKQADLPTPTSMPRVTKESEAVARTLGAEGARSLVFETEQKTPAEVGTYVVNRTGGPIVKEVRLKHDPK
jgi:hypothetical protein